MKSSLVHDKKALAKFRERINSDPQFQPHLRKNEPDWDSEVAKLHLTPAMEQELVSSLKVLWVLPFADVPVVREHLFFRYLKLPNIEAELRKAKDSTGLRLCALYVLLVKMVLQGNSIHPQSVTHLANRLRLVLNDPSGERGSFSPLLDLVVDETGTDQTGKNFAEAACPDLVILSEHQRREGAAEGAWKNNKFELYRQELLEMPDFRQDWKNLKGAFNLEQFRDSRGIIRRSAVPERNWQRPTHPELEVTRERFQATFDFFCWKWFLYGMKGDEPLVEKLTCTLTPYGTQIFIPGYWSFDAARDINWKALQRLHRARGTPKQGEKLSRNRADRTQQLAALRLARTAARKLGLKGEKFYSFLKEKAGLDDRTDNAQIRRLLAGRS